MGSAVSKPVPLNEKASSAEREEARADVTEQASWESSLPPYPAQERVIPLTLTRINDWNQTLLSDPKNRLAISSFADHSFEDILVNHNALQLDQHIFNLTVPVEGTPITNQRSSGRCWIFAATNIFRLPLIKAYQLKDFELSQAYLFYWDKIEKANWFFEQIIATAHEDLSSRLVQKLCQDPVSDGGQWDMVVNLVQKYGLVPHTLYPDGYHAQNSAKMNWLLTTKLRDQAFVLRELAAKSPHSLPAAKEQFLQEIHSLVTLLLGPPPSPDKKFVWQFSDANGTARDVQLTPLEFAQQAFRPRSISRGHPTVSTGRLFSLVNDPRHEFNRLLTIERLGNVVEGRPITYVNVEIDTIKNAIIAMLRAGYPVFFGCDVGKFYDRDRGVLDTDLTDLALGFNITLSMTKAQRVASGASSMTHAMVITGVHLDGDRPVRWRVENSWGEAAGKGGWFVMTDRWMDEYTFQAVVDFNFVSADVQAILEQSPKVLPRWDPMGVLA
ncbi:Peptidase, cysteine peptidase active site [Penicillium camemberti]|uniref:Cysteine proteinase 1, mitochondrial n=1 Tax=Penicillium camemberti (strain FM 013) TaxID=1429867 RepID=A0A0G4NZ94_PENC3|nr:Peptidase, cysteine peptidase active site [Penicillium camemberti]